MIAADKILDTIFFFPIITFLGLITIQEDFRKRKVSNLWVVFGIAYAFFVYGLLFLIEKVKAINCLHHILLDANYFKVLLQFFSRWVTNLFLSSLVAYFLWRGKMWGAGDAKLFICYAALIPLPHYPFVYFDYYFASFFLLLCIFGPATLFFLGKSFLRTKVKTRFFGFHFLVRNFIEKVTNKNTIQEFIVVFSTFFLAFFVLPLLQFDKSLSFLNRNALMIMMLLILNVIKKIFRKVSKPLVVIDMVIIAFLIIYYMLKNKNPFSFVFVPCVKAFFFPFIFFAGNRVVRLYGDENEGKETAFAHWMFFGVLIVWFLKI